MKKILNFLQGKGYELLAFSSTGFTATGKYLYEVKKTSRGFSIVKKDVNTFEECSPVIEKRTADELISFLKFSRNV